jgi:hypothetical protein
MMNDTYYNNNTNGNGGIRKTGQGFIRGVGGGGNAVSDMMRQSRMSVGFDHSSLERATPMEKGPITGPRVAGKFK